MNWTELLDRAALPDDVTVWDLRVHILRNDSGKRLIAAHPLIRDPAVDLYRRDGRAWPDDMLLGTLRELIDAGDLLHISFRDGGMHRGSGVRPRDDAEGAQE